MTEETQTGEQSNTINPDSFYNSEEPAVSEEKTEETTEVQSSEESSEDQNAQDSSDSNEDTEKKADADSNETEEESAEDIEIKLPEESSLTAEQFEDVKAFAKENNLSNEAAQKLLEKQSDLIDSYKDAQMERHEQLVQDWRDQSMKDPEIGGEELKQNVENCKRALEKFGSEQLIKHLQETGYGNHPEVVRVFSKIGKAMQADDYVFGNGKADQGKSIEEIFYGKQGE